MLDRRGFLAAMLGVAVAPKDVLAGIATPAPIKKAIEGWTCVWKEVTPVHDVGGMLIGTSELEIIVPDEIAHMFKDLNLRSAGNVLTKPR